MAETGDFMVNAGSLGFSHTFKWPDRYLPLLALAKAGDLDRRMAQAIPVLCGFAYGFMGL